MTRGITRAHVPTIVGLRLPYSRRGLLGFCGPACPRGKPAVGIEKDHPLGPPDHCRGVKQSFDHPLIEQIGFQYYIFDIIIFYNPFSFDLIGPAEECPHVAVPLRLIRREELVVQSRDDAATTRGHRPGRQAIAQDHVSLAYRLQYPVILCLEGASLFRSMYQAGDVRPRQHRVAQDAPELRQQAVE